MTALQFIFKARWLLLALIVIGIVFVGFKEGTKNHPGCAKDNEVIVPQPITNPELPVVNVVAPPRSIVDVLTGKPNRELRNVPESVRNRGVERIVRIVPRVNREVVETVSRVSIETTKTALIAAVENRVNTDPKETYTKTEVIELVRATVESLKVTVPDTSFTAAVVPIEIITTRDGETFVNGSTVSSAVVINFPDRIGFCWKFKAGLLVSTSHRAATWYTLPAVGGEFAYFQIYDNVGRKVQYRVTADVVANWEMAGVGISARSGKIPISLCAGLSVPYRNVLVPGPYVGVAYSF